MTARLLIAVVALAAGSVAQAQYVPYYGYGYGTTVNPLNGTVTQTGAAFNPFTGAPTVVSNGYNPFTGSVGQTVTQYNPYTGTTSRTDQAFNPYTGAGFNFVNAYNPYLNGGYGFGGFPSYGYGRYNPSYYPGVGRLGGYSTPAVTPPRVYNWNTTAKPGYGTGWSRR